MGRDAPEDRRRMMRFTPQGARVKAFRAGTILGIFGSGGDDMGGEVIDASGVGLRFISGQKLPLNTRLKITLSFKGEPPMT